MKFYFRNEKSRLKRPDGFDFKDTGITISEFYGYDQENPTGTFPVIEVKWKGFKDPVEMDADILRFFRFLRESDAVPVETPWEEHVIEGSLLWIIYAQSKRLVIGERRTLPEGRWVVDVYRR